jgi:threonine/homoserine/homoserine lactone efflux protein
MNLEGLGLIGTLGLGSLVGFLITLPPGPGVTLVLAYALEGKKKTAWKAAAGLIVGEIMIVLFCMSTYSFISTLSENRWVHLIGGAFLLGFALINFSGKKLKAGKKKKSPFISNFKLTLLNPNIWLALVTLAALAFKDFQTGLTMLVGIELGAAGWFSFVIMFSNKIPDSRHLLIQRCAMSFIALMGVYVMTNALFGQLS